MKKVNIPKLNLIRFLLWASLFFSAEGLVYYVRWFVPYLAGRNEHVVLDGKIPGLWFIVQICSNAMFLLVGIQLILLYRTYKQTGFFDQKTLRVFNTVIISCAALACLNGIQTIANNFYELHFSDWNSFVSISNLLLRSFTRLLVFREPVTMYLLLSIVLWIMKQFVTKAILVKTENESFV